jgi:hypothetical protein
MAEAYTIPFRSFSGGEVSPVLDGRTDQVKYQTGLGTCRNFFVRKEGPVSNRSGSKFVCPLPGFVSDYGRQIPFVFNNEQAYDIILLNQRMFWVRDGMPLFEATTWNIDTTSAVSPLTITSTAHGLSNDDMIYIDGVDGVPEINGRFFTVKNVGVNTFQAWEEAAIDPDQYGPYQSGGTIYRVYSIATPWAGVDLREIRYKQQNDIMVFTHEDYAPQKLSRLGETNWTLANAVFEPNIAPPANASGAGSAGSDTVRYRITAVDSNTLEESFPGTEAALAFDQLARNGSGNPISVNTTGNHGYSTGDRVTFSGIVNSNFTALNGNVYTVTVIDPDEFSLDGTDSGISVAAISPAGSVARDTVVVSSVVFPTPTDPITLTWNAVPNALEYNVYREINGIFGYIGTAGAMSLVDTGLSVNPFDTPPVVETFFDASDEYPSACGFFQQRSAWGGSTGDPEGTRVSRVGAFFNMTKSNPIQSDDSFSFGCSSGQVNRVKHYEELDRMCVFTQGSVFTIEGDEAGTLTPTAINPRKRSGSGAGTLQPLVAVSAILYVQYQGNVVQELVPGQPGQATTTKDLTVYSPHLFEFVDIVSWTFAEIPYSIVWAVRDDGTMLGLTYLKEHEIWGWHRHDTGDGDEFVDACAIPEGAESSVYLMTRRYMPDGRARLYVERMPTRLITDAVDGRFLDCYSEPEELTNETPGDTYELHYDADLGPLAWYLEATGTTTPWVEGEASPDIGRVILVYGPDGERLFCQVGAINSTFQAFVTVTHAHPEWTDQDGAPTDAFPFALPYETAEWSQSSTTIDRLWHLEGRQVMAICDGDAQGPFTVTNGSVTLEAQSVIRAAGLAIEADLRSLEPDILEGETIADKMKHVGQVTVRCERTTGLSVGLDEESLQPWDKEWNPNIREGALFSGKLKVPQMTKSDDEGTVFLRQSLPYPCTVSSLYVRLTTGRPG